MELGRLLWKAVVKEGTLGSSGCHAMEEQRAAWCSPALSGIWAGEGPMCILHVNPGLSMRVQPMPLPWNLKPCWPCVLLHRC